MAVGFPPLPPLQEPVGPPRRGRVAIWVVGVLAVGALVALPVLFIIGIAKYAMADDPTFLDDPVVSDTAWHACRNLRTYVAEHPLPVTGSPEEQVRVIRQQDQGITTLISTVSDLGTKRLEGDKPAVAWLADWQDLYDARESYADELAAGQPTDVGIPLVDGIPITRRMTRAEQCPVARALSLPLRPQTPSSPGSSDTGGHVAAVSALEEDGRSQRPTWGLRPIDRRNGSSPSTVNSCSERVRSSGMRVSSHCFAGLPWRAIRFHPDSR